jgi:probable inactive protein kinase-like protein SgK071
MILLVNALNAHPKEVILLDAACSSLLNLSSDAEEEVLVGSNVIEAVIATMRSQVDSSRVQEKCLGVLQNISMRSRQCKAMVSNAGGLEAVLATIREFIGTPSVVERAITTLWSLGVLEQNHNWIADNQGITLIINGMLANITHEKVQRQACGCLCTLSTSSCTKLMIRNVGGVDAVVYAMWAHYNSEDLLAEACRALSSLAVNVETNEVMLATEGEITAILGAMRRFPNSEKLQEHACVALRNFMLSSDNLPLIKFQKDEVEELMNVAATRYPNRCGDRARQVLQCIGA